MSSLFFLPSCCVLLLSVFEDDVNSCPHNDVYDVSYVRYSAMIETINE